jgi:hypothetical protein
VSEREELAASLRERHHEEKEEMQTANQLAVEALQRSLLLQGQQEVEQVEREYAMKMADLQVVLTAEHEKEKKSVRAKCEAEIHKHREQTEKLLTERKKEVSKNRQKLQDLYSPFSFCRLVCKYTMNVEL